MGDCSVLGFGVRTTSEDFGDSFSDKLANLDFGLFSNSLEILGSGRGEDKLAIALLASFGTLRDLVSIKAIK